MSLPLTSTILTDNPSHKHFSTDFFQMCYPCPNLFVCTYLSRYCEENHPISLLGPDYLAPDFLLIFLFQICLFHISFKMCIDIFGPVIGEIVSELIFLRYNLELATQ